MFFLDLSEAQLREAKAKFGWRIGHFDPRLPKDQWDAVRCGNVQWCPRCNTHVYTLLAEHHRRQIRRLRSERKRDKRARCR